MTEGTPLAPLTAPRSLAEDAADRIREQILSGGFSQGEHLVEAKIAEQLAISRGPVREAFKLLRSEGLLNEEPRRGTFVVSLSADDVRDIYGLRAALEGRAARTLARDRDPVAIERLRGLADQIDAAVATGEAAAVSRADLAFHQGLCALCGNARIVEVFDRYVPTMRAMLRLDGDVLGSLAEVSHQHRPLVDAIEAGDEDTAARLFAEHAEEAGELIAGVVPSADPA
jgi:GntR family transcriptional regulator, gluconate operon transcriptional repressor